MRRLALWPLAAIALGAAFVGAAALRSQAQNGLEAPSARPGDVVFRHLTVEQGLPSGAVSSVVQDALGFVWVGTLDGLVRYDGAEVREFRRSADTTSLGSNVVQVLAPTAGGGLWVGTDGGLNRYDPRTERFQRIRGLPADAVLALAADSAGGAWVGTVAGLAYVDAGGAVGEVVRANPGGLPDAEVEALYLSPEGDLWVGTGDGLARRRAGADRFTTVRPGDGGADFKVSTIVPDGRGQLIVGTLVRGLWTLDPGTGRLSPVGLGEGLEASLVTSALVAPDGAVWVGTLGGGLRRVVPGEDGVTVYRSTADDPGSLASDEVTDLFQDRQGVLWVATYDGLDRFDLARSTAVRLRHDPDDPATLASNDVRSILRASDGTLYVGTDVSLDRSADGRRFTHTVLDLSGRAAGGRRAHPVTALYEDRAGTVWVGTEGAGLYRVGEGGALVQAPVRQGPANGRPPELSVTSLLEDRAGRLWVGTLQHGLVLYDRAGQRAALLTHDPRRPASLADGRVLSLAETPDGDLWVGTERGLCRLDGTGGRGTFTCLTADADDPEALADGYVSALHAGVGALWVGTRGGLHRLDPDDLEAGVRRFTADDNDLPGDAIRGIIEDDTGNLWLSTNGGLSRFEPVTEVVRERLGADVGTDRTLTGALGRAPDGRLYVGSENGLLAFYPQQISDQNANPPDVVITGVEVAGQPVEPGPDAELAVAAPVADRVTLGPDQDYLTIHYAGLHFSNPAQNTYRVRLDGFDDDWRDVGTAREVTYNTLGPGRYTFQVQAVSADGVPSERAAVLDVVVRPPWWRTWWALLGFVALALYALVRADRWQRARLLRQERDRAEKRETELRAETAEAERRKAEAEAAALKAENDRKAVELDRAREVQEANAKLEAANTRLEASLRDLRETQNQLVQSEKLASLGQLTAGIAHEIKNPLNFVNNFADLSVDLAAEVGQELAEAGDRPVSEMLAEIGPLLDDLKDNARRIHEHGQRADRIVRAMLLHSRGGAGERGRVDLNRFVDEYANLAYHGARANDSDFQVALEREFDEAVGEVEIVPQELGRVLINLLTNAFHAVSLRSAAAGADYAPRVTLRTHRDGDDVVLEVADNGTGIPEAVRQRIFEPFFTTKPTGEGTGLGLSLAHDIVTQVHGGQVSVESEEGAGTTFRIVLPTRLAPAGQHPAGAALASPQADGA